VDRAAFDIRLSRHSAPSDRVGGRRLRVHAGAPFAGRSVHENHGRRSRTLMGLWIMAGVTFHEAARKKILWMALLAGVAFLTLFGTGMHFQVKDFNARTIPPFIRYQAIRGLFQVGFYGVDLLAVVMTVLTSVDTISGEINSGTIQAIATKPIPRWQVLIGKWAGFIGMAAAYVTVMFGGVV